MRSSGERKLRQRAGKWSRFLWRKGFPARRFSKRLEKSHTRVDETAHRSCIEPSRHRTRLEMQVEATNIKPRTTSALADLMFGHRAYREIVEAVKAGTAEITISGVTATAKALLVAGLARDLAAGPFNKD